MYGNPPPPPPPYAMLNGGNQYYPNGPYYHPNAPQYYPRKKSHGCGRSCCRCICCCCCCILLILLIQLLAVLYFYHVYDPKVPSYTIENIDVKAFDMKPDSTLTTDLHVSIRAENPNKNIGFIYGDDSRISVNYSSVDVCAGKLPAFQQVHGNTTILEIDLKGNSKFGSELQHDFAEDQKSHRIPLMVKMKVPVNVVLGDVPLREFKVFVNCSMVVDNLSPNETARIISRETVFAIEF